MSEAVLDRLVLNLSQDCNLRCRYCYADSGAYHGPRGLLSSEKGREFLDYFFSVFNQIGFVQFFGGEPLLNSRVLDDLCSFTLQLCDQKNVTPPLFGLVTNGTIINRHITNTILKHKIFVTVSLDGFADVHDSARVFNDGSGSFERVVSVIRSMKAETGQPVKVEGTFTSTHLEKSFSLAEFMAFLNEDLGISSLHMPWIIGDCYNNNGILPTRDNLERLIETYSGGVGFSMRSMTSPKLEETILLSFVERFLTRQFGERPSGHYMCPAGTGTLAVDTAGSIYPCFMFIGSKKLRLGAAGSTRPGTLCRRREVFAGKLSIPEDLPRSALPYTFCAGLNNEANGSFNQMPVHEKWINRRLSAFLGKELTNVYSDRNMRSWIKAKFILYRMLMGMSFSPLDENTWSRPLGNRLEMS